MCARLSALIFLFTVRSAFQYFFLYLSFGLFELDSTNFLFGGSPVIDGMPGCDPLFLFFCRRPEKDSLVWVYAVLTWSHMVLIPAFAQSYSRPIRSLQHKFFSHSSQPYGRKTATKRLDRRRHREDPEERSPELLQQLERHLPIVSAKQDPGKDHNPASKRVFEREGMH